MKNRQLAIPGLTPPTPTKPKKLTLRDQVSQLQDRMLKLELEVSLLRILVENPKQRGDK